MNAICCRLLVGLLQEISSPFLRLVATAYYDGPTEGLIECGICGTTYAFNQLDWDDQQNVRIFSLAPVGVLRLNELADSCGADMRRWPSWALVDTSTASFAAQVEKVRASAFPEEFIVANRNLLGTLALWRPVGLGPHVDWFKELKLDRLGSPDD